VVAADQTPRRNLEASPTDRRASGSRRSRGAVGPELNDQGDAGAVGRVLRLARARRGWSIREVARRTGFPNTYLSQVERGVIRRPDPAALWELAALYNLDFALLAKWSGRLSEHEDSARSLLSAALRAFSSLDEEGRLAALRFMKQLTPASDPEAEGRERLT
jgi:transcriptional regulator with XRE-family HTH domain